MKNDTELEAKKITCLYLVIQSILCQESLIVTLQQLHLFFYTVLFKFKGEDSAFGPPEIAVPPVSVTNVTHFGA